MDTRSSSSSAIAGAAAALACGLALRAATTQRPAAATAAATAGTTTDSTSSEITGGCLCGAVRYKLSGTAKSTYHCHCLMCRKIHGALFATFSVFPSTSWELTSGHLSVYFSSPGTTREFCGRCGCQILSRVPSMPDDVFVTCGSMDEHVHPGHAADAETHIFAADRCTWKDFISIDAAVASFEKYEQASDGSGFDVDEQGKLTKES